MPTYKMFSVSLDAYFYFQNIKIQEGVKFKSWKMIKEYMFNNWLKNNLNL